GNLYDRLGRPDDAMKHWRLASGVAGVLPVLPASRALPAADTRGDPTLIDVERLPAQAQVLRDLHAPLAASAADFVSDDIPASAPSPASAAASTSTPDVSSPSAAASDLDEYFDSAPIPGVDLSQTSDRPPRGSGHN